MMPAPLWLMDVRLDWENEPKKSFKRMLSTIKVLSGSDKTVTIYLLAKKLKIQEDTIINLIKIL